MNIPGYVWKYGLILLTINEIRKWVDLYLTFHENDDDEEMPDCVRHMYN